jgi:hypothetical protein
MDDKKNFYCIEKGESFTCVGCDCHPDIHLVGWSCPIFSNEAICFECCQIDTLNDDIDKKFSEKLGYTITKEEINKICTQCGKNNAKQDISLSPEVINQDKSAEK